MLPCLFLRVGCIRGHCACREIHSVAIHSTHYPTCWLPPCFRRCRKRMRSAYWTHWIRSGFPRNQTFVRLCCRQYCAWNFTCHRYLSRAPTVRFSVTLICSSVVKWISKISSSIGHFCGTRSWWDNDRRHTILSNSFFPRPFLVWV